MAFANPEWPKIIDEIGPALYRFFLGSFSSAQASDLVQETLIRLVNKQRGGLYIPEIGSMKAYAFGIARFVRLEALKDDPGYDLVEDEKSLDVQSTPALDASDPVAHLRWAIRQLKPSEQEIILMMIDNELQLAEISAVLDIPLGTVKSHVHRAKENLKQIMLGGSR
jgi:RNA polymerase sigma-70 factor (ECF subfamily)